MLVCYGAEYKEIVRAWVGLFEPKEAIQAGKMNFRDQSVWILKKSNQNLKP